MTDADQKPVGEKIIAYYACQGCGDDRSYPAEMMGITKDGDLWCWDCPQELYNEDDPDRPILGKFTPPLELQNAELRKYIASWCSTDNHTPDQREFWIVRECQKIESN